MACVQGVRARAEWSSGVCVLARPGADYGLGRILAEAYPDQAKLQEIWKLYTDSLASGGSLLSLTPVKAGAAAESPAKEVDPKTPQP
jgi:hypothetical protein